MQVIAPIDNPARRPKAARRTGVMVLVAWLALGLLGPSIKAQNPAGRSLEQALIDLRQQGLDLVFTSTLVRPDMRVLEPPRATEPRKVLEQLLRPHGLTAREGPGGALMVVPAAALPQVALGGSVTDRGTGRPLGGVVLRLPEADLETRSAEDGSFSFPAINAGRYSLHASLAGFVPRELPLRIGRDRPAEIALELQAVPLTLDAIEVVSRYLSSPAEAAAPLAFQGDSLRRLPHVGDDLLRTMTLMPGTSGNDRSASFSIRGGRRDEVQVRLDGLEILEPYHLKDFDSALSILAPETIAEVELMSGGFAAEYGDRMGGVLELRSVEPESRRRAVAGLSVLNGQLSHSGLTRQGDGGWLASLRGGSLQPALEIAHEEENPAFWDLFAKLDRQLGPRQDLRANLLFAEDQLDFQELIDGGSERFRTRYINGYGWLTHLRILGDDAFVESLASYSRIERDRRGLEAVDAGGFSLDDLRRLDVAALKQTWSWRVEDHHELRAGLEARRLETRLDYRNDRRLEDPLAAIREVPRVGTTRFESSLDSEHYSLHARDRWRHGRFTLELGARLDQNALTDELHLSPRLNVVGSFGTGTSLRLAWGHFYQSQRAYELPIEDGETTFSRDERAEHRILGLEHIFDEGPVRSLRAELYQRRFRDPRDRFENLFLPISIVPELEADRVRIEPDSARAQGLELLLHGRPGKHVDWFLSYTWSQIEDRIDGRDVRRGIDQPHALRFDLGYRDFFGWDVNLAGHYHTGWPTTAIEARPTLQPDGTLAAEPVLGPLFGERLPDYSRFDLRLSRRWPVRRGELLLFLEVQNLTNNRNVAGFEVEFQAAADGVTVVKTPEYWNGTLPSLGVTWSF